MTYRRCRRRRRTSSAPALYFTLTLGDSVNDQPIYSQQYYSPNEARYDGPYPLSSSAPSTEAKRPQDIPPDNRSYNTDDDCEYYSAGVIPRHDPLGQYTGNEPDYDPEKYGPKHLYVAPFCEWPLLHQ
jgi:hypothetical protein